MSSFRNIKRGLAKIVAPYPFTPAENQNHIELDTDTLKTLNVPKGVYDALVQAADENIRYTIDGTNPTSTSGFILFSGNDPLSIPVVGGRTTLKFISETAGATLQLQYGE